MTPKTKEQITDMLYSAFAAEYALKKEDTKKYLRCIVNLFECGDILKNE